MVTQIENFFTVLLAICGGLTIIYGAISIVLKIFSPYRELETQVKKNTKKIDSYSNRLEELEDTNRLLLKCMMLLIDHEITGNSIDKLKELKSEIRDFLVEK